MHHGTFVTHVPWCMPGKLTRRFLRKSLAGKTSPAYPAHAQPTILRIWQEAQELWSTRFFVRYKLYQWRDKPSIKLWQICAVLNVYDSNTPFVIEIGFTVLGNYGIIPIMQFTKNISNIDQYQIATNCVNIFDGKVFMWLYSQTKKNTFSQTVR